MNRIQAITHASDVEIVNTLSAAQRLGSIKRELAEYVHPAVPAIDERSCLTIDQAGANMLRPANSQR